MSEHSEQFEAKNIRQSNIGNIIMALGLVLTLIIAIAQLFIAPSMWRLINSVGELEVKMARTETFIEQFTMEGPRYTATDAEKDVGVLLGILERQGKVLDDHEGRIRTIERTLP